MKLWVKRFNSWFNLRIKDTSSGTLSAQFLVKLYFFFISKSHFNLNPLRNIEIMHQKFIVYMYSIDYKRRLLTN